MTIDWTADLLDPIYDGLGVAATITLEGGAEHVVTAIDGASDLTTGDQIEVHTMRPAAFVRMAELIDLGLQPDDLEAAIIALNGKPWRVAATALKPTPGGEAAGELILWLQHDSTLGDAMGDTE